MNQTLPSSASNSGLCWFGFAVADPNRGGGHSTGGGGGGHSTLGPPTVGSMEVRNFWI